MHARKLLILVRDIKVWRDLGKVFDTKERRGEEEKAA